MKLNKFRIITINALALGSLIVGAITPVVASAAAPASGVVPNTCHVVTSAVEHTNWTGMFTVPADSSCNDINVAFLITSNKKSAGLITEFYPSDGSGPTCLNRCNATVVQYNKSTYVVLSTAVLAGTKFKIANLSWNSGDTWQITVKD